MIDEAFFERLVALFGNEARPRRQSKLHFCIDLFKELARAEKKFKPFNSAHEGYAVILEELDELWDLVREPPSHRLRSDESWKECVRRECIQIAAMSLRFILDVSAKDGER